MSISPEAQTRAGSGLPAMGNGLKYAILGIASGVWLTGLGWLVCQYFFVQRDEFGFDGPNPMQKWWLIGHALFAFWSVWMFGVLWQGHIKSNWRHGLGRKSGGALFGITSWLILSGFLLYYLGSDTMRGLTSVGHWSAGLSGILVLPYHLVRRAKHR